jgi:hypothetical protein
MISRAPFVIGFLAFGACALASGCATGSGQASQGAMSDGQRIFETPQAAVDAMIAAARKQDRPALRAIFGPDVARLNTGDQRQDNIDFQRFVATYDLAHHLKDNGDQSYNLIMGAQEWTFPAPIIHAEDGKRWMFDTNAGIDEIINRTIGRDELLTIQTCNTAYLQAQQQYFDMNPEGDGVHAYAQRLRSTPGKHDGLYWPDEPGKPTSPLGPLVTQATSSGDLDMTKAGLRPYHGYYARVLTAQGPGAPGGAKNYVDANGRMTGGCALIAWPEDYGQTGVMTFIVNKDGIVYQKDLGEHTDAEAAKIMAYDPAGWAKAEGE